MCYEEEGSSVFLDSTALCFGLNKDYSDLSEIHFMQFFQLAWADIQCLNEFITSS